VTLECHAWVFSIHLAILINSLKTLIADRDAVSVKFIGLASSSFSID
jgi:hypothetical protein